MTRHSGSCLCGAVKFEVAAELQSTDACHCSLCRKFSGHYWASVDLPRDAVKIEGEDNITWYRSSEKVRRGFCATCGASLFFDPIYRDWLGIALGAFDKPTGARIGKHIFVADKGDYYEIGDGVPQEPRPLG